MTKITGTYKLCGGNSFALDFTCTGPQCDVFKDYPDTTCTASNGALSCKSGSSCSDAPFYSSTFTFDQQKVQVTTTDEITLTDLCEKIIITSDGTKAGTQVKNVDINNCAPKGFPGVSSSASSEKPTTSSTTSEADGTTMSPRPSGYTSSSGAIITPSRSIHNTSTGTFPTPSNPIIVSGAGKQTPRATSVAWVWCSLLLLFSFFTLGTAAGVSSDADLVVAARYAPPAIRDAAKAPHPNKEIVNLAVRHALNLSPTTPNRQPLTLDERQLLGDAIKLARELIAHFKSHVPESDIADILVQRIMELACDGAAGWGLDKLADAAVAKAFAVEFTTVCRAAVIDIVFVTAPEIELAPFGAWLVNFAAARLCGFMLAEAFGIPKIVDKYCAFEKPCTKNFLEDPKNCGRCGNICATGVCNSGACTSALCKGETCNTFTTCGAGSTCVCASTAEGTGYCVDGNTPCAGLPDCKTSDNCPAGQICAVGSCCDRNVCVGASFCGGSKSTSAAALLMPRSWENNTIADLGVWVP